MKKLTFLILVMVMFFGGCSEDTVNLDPIGDIEPEFFQNDSHMQQAVFGIYQKLSFFYGFSASQNNHVLPVTLLPSDDLTSPASFALENFTALNGSTGQIVSYYRFAYQLIARANTVLEKIAENGDVIYESNPDLKNYHIGEALFFRAYMYFCLWNVYGTAPLVTERITVIENAYPPNSTGTQLLDQAIIDLQEAANLLPDSWPAAFKGRVVKNSALGLRGKCLVFRGTVNNSNTDFTEAIANFNAISGVSLASQYSHNFDVAYENNVESLFEYQANSSPGNVNPFVVGGTDAFALIGEIGHYTGVFDQRPTWIGNSYFSATSSIKNAYEDGDPRRSYNISPDDDALVNVRKYITHNAYATGPFGAPNGVSVNNPRILRYADVLLLHAEAIARSGGSLSQAIGLINQVRERARNSTEDGVPSPVPADRSVSETNASTVLEWVFQERRVELAFEEGHRWWDLRRRHIIGEIDLKTLDFGSLLIDFQFQDHNVNFPLPFSEVDENPNLNQNTGY